MSLRVVVRIGIDLESRLLEQRAVVLPARVADEHAGFGRNQLEKIRANPKLWADTVVVVTYDENGGFWDHAPVPRGPGWSDRWGPGTRVPALVISPFAKKGNVDHTAYDTESILKLITRRFKLDPLPGLRANMGDLTNALTFD